MFCNSILKTKSVLLLVFKALLSCYFTGVYGQIYKLNELSKLQTALANDSVGQISYKAAFNFHALINAYRKSNTTDTIMWDDVLWLTCYNHNKWLEANNVLSHHQKPGTPLFSGNGPGERYLYTTNNEGKYYWSGENALYNYHVHGKNIEEIATCIANYSFKQWQSSPGHNANMLSHNHRVHGCAFYITKEGKVYGTDLFASNVLKPEEKTNIKNNHLAVETHSVNSLEPKKNVRLNLARLDELITSGLYKEFETKHPELIVRKNKAMEKASEKHSAYLCHSKTLSHNELNNKSNFYGKTKKERLLKASNGFAFFYHNRINLTEELMRVEFDSREINTDKIVAYITNSLNNRFDNSNKKVKLAYGLCLKQHKNHITVYVTRLTSGKRA